MDRLPRMYETVRSADGFQGTAEGYDAGEVRVYDTDGRLRFFPVDALEPVVLPVPVSIFDHPEIDPLHTTVLLTRVGVFDERDHDGYPENLGPES